MIQVNAVRPLSGQYWLPMCYCRADALNVNVTGLLVHARPGRAESVRMRLARLPGVEVHAATDDGRLVVTVEHESEGEMLRTFERVRATSGVEATTLVYHHSEPGDDPSHAKRESRA